MALTQFFSVIWRALKININTCTNEQFSKNFQRKIFSVENFLFFRLSFLYPRSRKYELKFMNKSSACAPIVRKFSTTLLHRFLSDFPAVQIVLSIEKLPEKKRPEKYFLVSVENIFSTQKREVSSQSNGKSVTSGR